MFNKFLTFFALVFSLVMMAQPYSIASIPENLKKNAYAVIRSHSELYTLNAVNEMEIAETSVISILNSSGAGFATVAIPYNPFSKISDVQVSILDKEGKEIKKIFKKDFTDVSNNRSNALYVDDRILYFSPLVTEYPYTIKYSFTTKTSNTAYLNFFAPVSSFNEAVEKSSVTIKNNSGILLKEKIQDSFLGKVSKIENGSTATYTYENLPALSYEPLAPNIEALVPYVDFALQKFSLADNEGDNSSWDVLGKWYYSKLIQPKSAITPEIKREIAALQLSGTTSDKVKAIYQYMQAKTRYILVSMGIGGWQPMNADEVRKKGYGDCKALTNYMRTLLAAADIPSYFCVINDHPSAKTFDQNFIELSGNHAVLMIPTENAPIWLENTCQNIAFNHLNYTSHYRNVLAVKENGIELINTPVYQPKDSKEVLVSKVKILEDNSITAHTDFKFSGGQYDMNMPLFYFGNTEMKEALKNRYRHLVLENIEVKNLINNRDVAEIDYELNFKASNYSNKLGNDLFFRVMPFPDISGITADADRTLPFETPFPYQDDHHVEFDIPTGFQFSDLPKNEELKSEFGSYTINYKTENGKLQVHRVLTINRGSYPKEKYQNYVDFRKKTAVLDNTKVLITKL